MVAKITLASPRRAEHHALASQLADEADAARERLEEARAADEDAYGFVVSAMSLPKGTPEEKAARTEVLQRALVAAAQTPLTSAALAVSVLWLADRALALNNPALASDLGCAAEFAAAGIAAAAYNVRVNHAYIHDAAAVSSQTERLIELEAEGPIVLDRVRVGVSVALAR